MFLLLIYNSGLSQVNEIEYSQLYNENIITETQSDLIFEKIKALPNYTQVSIAIIEDGTVKYFGVSGTLRTNSSTDFCRKQATSPSELFTA